MTTIKIIITFLNILMILILLFFTRGLSWENKKDHASIVGFVFMICLFTINSMLIWY